MRTYNIAVTIGFSLIVLFVITNTYFGWNETAESEAERIWDNILKIMWYVSLILLSISVSSYVVDKMSIFRKGYHVYYIVYQYTDKEHNNLFEIKSKIGLKNQSDIIKFRELKKISIGDKIRYDSVIKPYLCNGSISQKSISYLGKMIITDSDKLNLFIKN